MLRKAFTLIELLVVISIIAILMTIMLPSLKAAREQSRAAVCLSRLRQNMVAATVYCQDNGGRYPVASAYEMAAAGSSGFSNKCWDISSRTDSQGRQEYSPGILWEGMELSAILQCPSFKGSSNWGNALYTGYNYNVSFIGRVEGDCEHGFGCRLKCHQKTTREQQITNPSGCAVFGDGEFVSGANKFMRSPTVGAYDIGFQGRYAGTQGFRHRDKTNVAWADGHVSSQAKDYSHESDASKSDKQSIAEGTGFLSPDNSAYDLR
jgi:prepilin-type N-terminal cleavage/methylation domain-containing protein/prepilin-type processing-associated H-X9-DG protein